MTEAQIAKNDAVVREAAARVEAIGYTGDAHRFVESLLMNCHADGWRPIERIPDLRPANVATDEERRARIAEIRQQLDKRNRQEMQG